MSKRSRKPKANPQFPKAKGRTAKKRFEELDNIHYKIVIAFAVLYLLHAVFISEKTIGHDDRYTWYVFLIPTCIGALLLILYQWKFVGDFFSDELKGWIGWVIRITFSILISLVLAYLTFGNLANIAWEYINTREANQHMPETFYCPITEFSEGSKNNKIWFTFKGERENIKVSYNTMKPYSTLNPVDYTIELVTRKGIWNYYVVDTWDIKNKND